MENTKANLGRFGRFWLAAGLIVLGGIGVIKLSTEYILPQLHRGQTRKNRAELFRLLTEPTVMFGMGHTESEQPQMWLRFLKSESDPLIDPSDPVFPLRKYKFEWVSLKKLTDQSDPAEPDPQRVVTGRFLTAKENRLNYAAGYKLGEKDEDSCLVLKDHRVLFYPGGNRDPLEMKEVSGSEWERLKESRQQRRAELVDARHRREEEVWRRWAEKIRTAKDYQGVIRYKPEGGLHLESRVNLRAYVTCQSYEQLELKLVFLGDSETVSLDLAPADVLKEKGVIFSDRELECEVTRADLESGAFEMRVSGKYKSRVVKGEIELKPMTAAEVTAENEAAERQRRALEAKALRRRQVIYLLNRRQGLEVRLDTGAEGTLVGHFEALPWPKPLKEVIGIDTLEIKYRISLTNSRGERFDHIMSGTLTPEEKGAEELHLKMTGESRNPAFTDLELDLRSFELAPKSARGEWKGRMQPTADEKTNSLIASVLGSMITGKLQPSVARGHHFSGDVTLQAIEASPDDSLLGSAELTPVRNSSKVPGVSKEGAERVVRAYINALNSSADTTRSQYFTDPAYFYSSVRPLSHIREAIRQQESQFPERQAMPGKLTFGEATAGAVNVLAEVDLNFHGKDGKGKWEKSVYFMRVENTSSGPRISRISDVELPGWRLAKYRARISSNDIRRKDGVSFKQLPWQSDEEQIREIVLQDRANYQLKRTSDAEDEPCDYFKRGIDATRKDWQKAGMRFAVAGSRARLDSGEAIVDVAIFKDDAVVVTIVR